MVDRSPVPTPATTPADAGLLGALDRLEQALAANVDRSNEARRRIARLRTACTSGETVHDVLRSEPSPRTVELLSANHATLETVGAEFRASLAHALRHDGLTIEAIADLFGVTRQRISALLRQSSRT